MRWGLLCFEPIVFNDFLLLDSHHNDGISTLAYNSMDWPLQLPLSVAHSWRPDLTDPFDSLPFMSFDVFSFEHWITRWLASILLSWCPNFQTLWIVGFVSFWAFSSRHLLFSHNHSSTVIQLMYIKSFWTFHVQTLTIFNDISSLMVAMSTKILRLYTCSTDQLETVHCSWVLLVYWRLMVLIGASWVTPTLISSIAIFHTYVVECCNVSLKDERYRRQPERTVRACVLTVQETMLAATSE